MEGEEACVDMVDELKIDKDCHVGEQWIRHYVCLIKSVCKKFGLRVLSIKKCSSKSKGIHFYIAIEPSIHANLANQIQWLLGDDSNRVDFNRARIEVGLPDWNKLFEKVGARLRTIYRAANHEKTSM